MNNRPIRIAITTGDHDGIGTEIVAKALSKIKPPRGVQLFLWRTPHCPIKHLKLIDKNFRRITVKSWPEALAHLPSSPKELVDIESNLSPAIWVEMMAEASFFRHIDGMATAPLSKTAIKQSGMSDIGHTEILKRVTKSKSLYMAFLGEKFNVVLATGHLPLSAVPETITPGLLGGAIEAALNVRSYLKKKSDKPVGLIGLNPHAGELGIIGGEEKKVYAKIMKKSKEKKWQVEGPLVPDFAFFPENWKKYSVYVSPYHDQGLIPFKMVHGHQTGVHLTMGLPFIRTSVDHGTAKNIFGQNKADPSSMMESINWAVQLCRQKIKKRNL